jgi:acyl-CoA synthetase (AMP-forming)/AMP-acid ligase II
VSESAVRGREATARGEPKTLDEAILGKAAAAPDDIAIVSSAYKPFTYGELVAHSDRFGETLRQSGFGPDARIAVLLKDPPVAAVAIVCASCSTVAVPLDPNLMAAELEARLRLLNVDAVMMLAGDVTPMRDLAAKYEIPIIEVRAPQAGELGLDLFVAGKSRRGTRLEGAEAPAFILQTSGTTAAEPSLIPYSHSNLAATAARVRRWFDLGASDRCLSVTPVYYCHGLTATVMAPLMSGGSVAFPANPHLVNLQEWFGSLRPTWLSAGPTMFHAILDKARADDDERIRHDLRFVVSGGASLPLKIQTDLQTALGVPVLEHYGATEAGQISSNLPPPGPAKAGTCGIPEPGTLKIADPKGGAVDSGERGEVLVRGPAVVAGYLDNPESNKTAFVDGWYHTGDIGSLDDEGFLTLHGRLKEIISRGGEKISPREIDIALLRHPDVAEAAAFPVPHPRLGEDIAAAVVLRPGSATTGEELRRFLASELSWFKVPRRISIMSDLPKGKTGKVQRRKLSEGATGHGK